MQVLELIRLLNKQLIINVEAKSLLKKTMADADVPSASIGALLQTI